MGRYEGRSALTLAAQLEEVLSAALRVLAWHLQRRPSALHHLWPLLFWVSVEGHALSLLVDREPD